MEVFVEYRSTTLKIGVPSYKENFTYRRLLAAFHKHYRKKHAEWTMPIEYLRFYDTVLDHVVSAERKQLVVLDPPSFARSACAAFGTLDLVEAKAGTLPGERTARHWYLRKGVLSEDGVRWALREGGGDYKFGFACSREGKFEDAVSALARAASDDAYDEGFRRKIFHEWALAVAATESRLGDRWNEVAIHKYGASLGVWDSWERRPVDAVVEGLVPAKPVWNDDGLSIPQKLLAVQGTDFSLLEAEPTVRRCYVSEQLPGAHVATRCANTNAFLRAERTIAGDVAYIRVADKLIHDSLVVYDPSFEHELWYEPFRADDTVVDASALKRVALVCEFDHPNLSADDKKAIIDDRIDHSYLTS